MANQARFISGYGLSAALPNIFPAPIIALRAPLASDTGYQLGQVWVYKATPAGVAVNSAYILCSVIAASATWQEISAGGADQFTSLIVTPGPIALTGAFTLVAGTNAVHFADDAADHAITMGSLTGASATLIQGGTSGVVLGTAVTGVITIGSANMTGAISLGRSTAGQIINIGNAVNVGAQVINIASGGGAGANTVNIANGAAASTVSIGNVTGASALSLSSGTGGISLVSAGNVKMGSGAVSAAAYAATLSAQVGQVTLTGQVLASAGVQVLTITNALCTATTPIFVTVNNLGANDAQLTVQRIQPQAGSFLVTVKNNGAAALNGDIHVNFWLLS